MTTKKRLHTDTVLRREHDGTLYLMNNQEEGFQAWGLPIPSEQWLLDHYHVQVGEWGRDAHGECCPVIRVSAPALESAPGYWAGIEERFFGGESQTYSYEVDPATGHLTLQEDGPSSSEVRELKRNALTLPPDMADEVKCNQPLSLPLGLQQFSADHPGAQILLGSGPYHVALMHSGVVLTVDNEGSVVSDET